MTEKGTLVLHAKHKPYDEKLHKLIIDTPHDHVGHNEGFRGVFKASQGDA